MTDHLALILVKPKSWAHGYVVAKLIGADVYEALSDSEARQVGLADGNEEHTLAAAVRRLAKAKRACERGAPWMRPATRRANKDG